MARLIYSAIMSLDGYTADADGRFEWATPDEEVHAPVNELERPIGTRTLPDQARLNLTLAQEHRFGCGTVYLCYRPAQEGGVDPC
jgi:hypothetical protein